MRVANGAIVESEVRWKGRIEVNSINTNVKFEVFNSGGKWDFLFGKALLEKFKVIHDYESDKITVHGTGGKNHPIQPSTHHSTTTKTHPSSVYSNQ